MTEHIRHIAILLLALSTATAVMMAIFQRPAPRPMQHPTLSEFQDHGKAERKKAVDAMRITKMAIELAKARAAGRQEQAQ
jgi:hypothetical protein